MRRKWIIISLLGLCSLSAAVVWPRLSDSARNYTSKIPVKAETYVEGNFNGTYANADKSLPPLPDSLSHVDTLLIAWKSQYRMQLYYSGKLQKTYIIGLGQEPIGHKQQQGDNRTPEGNYRIIQKTVGPFTGGESSAWLGTRWMRLNYPNNADAKSGLDRKLISREEYNRIVSANKAGKEPPKNTKLGGGIGIHGWNGSWPGDDQQDLTWGCISFQNDQVEDLYDRVGLQTRVIICK